MLIRWHTGNITRTRNLLTNNNGLATVNATSFYVVYVSALHTAMYIYCCQTCIDLITFSVLLNNSVPQLANVLLTTAEHFNLALTVGAMMVKYSEMNLTVSENGCQSDN